MNTVTTSKHAAQSEPDAAVPSTEAVDVAGDPVGGAPHRRSAWRVTTVAVATVAAAIVVVDGSPTWIVGRLAIIGVAAGGLLVLDGRWPILWAVVGAILASAGAGLLPHLLDDGPTAIGLAAVALIASGLTLLIAATVDLLRPHRWWWRVGGTVIAIAVVGLTASVVTPAVLATNVPRPGLGETPERRGLDSESVTFATRGGVDIAAWYVAPRNGAAVVLRHGAGSTRSDVLDEAVVIARHGYGVLMTDAQGHGDSGGRAMDFGWNGDIEVAAAVDFLRSRPEVDRIGLVGLSMGGEEVLGAVGSEPLVRAVVAEGATARRAADKAWLSDVYGLRGGLQEQLERLQYGLTDLLTDAAPPAVLRDAVRRSDAAVLLITAGEVPDELHAAAHIASGSPDRVEVWTVPGAGHTDGLATDPDGWERRVIEFLDANL